MKFTLAFLVFVLGAGVVTKASAQVSNQPSSLEKPISKFDPATGLESIVFQSGLKSLSQTPKDTSKSSRLFRGELPIVKGSRTVINGPVIASNMPVLRPKGSSKILIAKVDMEFPYHYNMPVKKIGVNEN